MRSVDSQRGAALVVTMVLVTALLTVAAIAVSLQMADTRSVQYVKEARGALYCAESGLVGARDFIMTNRASWDVMLDGNADNDPDGYPIEGDLDGDGAIDWRVTIRDDDDERPTDNPSVDANNTIFMVSTCLMHPDNRRQVLELIALSGGGTHYRNQSGQGAGGSNNRN